MLSFLLTELLQEQSRYAKTAIPKTLHEQRRLLQALCNTRLPRPLPEAWFKAQDAELQIQLAEKGIIYIDSIPASAQDSRLRLWQGDITRLALDAIVNAANAQMLGCFAPLHACIDNAIHSAAGVQLREECHAIMQAQGYDEPTGMAKITKAYNLPSRYVLHTVGPIIQTGPPSVKDAQELASCYTECLTLAEAYHLESVAFCCISTGVFRYPAHLAAQVAVKAVQSYLNLHKDTSIKTVIFNVFKDQDRDIYGKLLA